MRHKGISVCGAVFILVAMLGTGAQASEAIRTLSLSESIETALKQSVLIHAAREGARGAEEQRKEALTGFLPKFNTTYSYARLNEDPFFVFPGSPPLIPAGSIKTGTKDNYNWTIEGRQPVFAGGGILANYEASRLAAEIARLDQNATVQDLVLEVKVAYFSILKADRILAVARQSVQQLNAHRDTAQDFFDVGIIPRNDLLQAEVELANGRQFFVRAENALEMAKSKFNTILRRDIGAPVQIEDILEDRPLTVSLEACLAAAQESRPEIRSFLLRVDQAHSMVDVSKSEYYPNVNLVGNYARYGDTPGVAGSPYKDQESWAVMAVANWNFWEWGKTGNRVAAGVSRANQAADALTHIRDQITLEVKNAFLQLNEAKTQIRVTRKSVEQARENFRINTERYHEQVGTATEVIDAQTLVTKALSDHTTALGDLNISRSRLERAMGIGPREGL